MLHMHCKNGGTRNYNRKCTNFKKKWHSQWQALKFRNFLAERAQRVKPLSVHVHWDLRYMSELLLLYVQSIPEAVAMWRLQIKRSWVRFPHWNFFFHSFFFSVSSFFPLSISFMLALPFQCSSIFLVALMILSFSALLYNQVQQWSTFSAFITIDPSVQTTRF